MNVPRLIASYYALHPELANAGAARGVRDIGTSRECVCRELQRRPHRRDHAGDLSSTRKGQGTDGPLFLAQDTHALSEPAFTTALEVLAANGVEVMIDARLATRRRLR